MLYFKSIAACILTVLPLTVFAGNITSTNISDNYIGAGHSQDVNGGSKYDIQSMTVSRTGTWMTVDIFTNFVGHNDNSIGFGDLFMAADENDPNANPWKPDGTAANNYNTDRFAGNDYNGNHVATTNTNWNYAYTLQDWTAGGQYDDRDASSGQGRLVSGFDDSDLRHSNTSSHRRHQAVALNSSVYNGSNNSNNAYDNLHYNGTTANADSSHWNYGSNSWSSANGKISFAFDVSGTALASANQIAFRWAMTCANDIIEGLVSVNTTPPPLPVPEPQTLLLMLLGLAGISYRRKLSQ